MINEDLRNSNTYDQTSKSDNFNQIDSKADSNSSKSDQIKWIKKNKNLSDTISDSVEKEDDLYPTSEETVQEHYNDNNIVEIENGHGENKPLKMNESHQVSKNKKSKGKTKSVSNNPKDSENKDISPNIYTDK